MQVILFFKICCALLAEGIMDVTLTLKIYISGLVGFMGNGDLGGLIFTHKSEWGFIQDL